MTRDRYLVGLEMRADDNPSLRLRELERRRKDLEDLAARLEASAETKYAMCCDISGDILTEDACRCRREIDAIDDEIGDCRAEISRLTGRQFGRKAEEQEWNRAHERGQ